jgi:amino acid transporter
MGFSFSFDPGAAAEPKAPVVAEPNAAATTTKRIREGESLLPVQQERKRVLGLMAMSAIIWFNVSGGPSGSEQVVAAAGPIAGLGLMLCFVVFYSVPQALMTAELSTAFADNGGYSLWVKAAFGDFWAVQESLWSFGSGVADSALYPVLFYHVCQKLVRWVVGYGNGLEQTSCTISLFRGERFGLLGAHRNPMLCATTDWMCAAEWGCKVLILFVFAGPNLVSTKLVGTNLFFLATFVVRRHSLSIALTLRPHPRR